MTVEDELHHSPPAHVAHYYGDAVRQFFIVLAILILLGAPWYGSSLRIELPFEVIGALILVTLAALVNPHQKSIMVANAVVAGVGAVVYQMWALFGWEDGTVIQFVLREGIAILFLAAFYFSMKTVRAFLLHKIGKHDEVGEFDD
jgi:hypothetical protein